MSIVPNSRLVDSRILQAWCDAIFVAAGMLAEDARTAAENSTDYAQSVLKIEAGRMLIAIGGYREQPAIELWIGPVDGPRPPVTPTVDPKDVRPAAAQPTRRP